ncbi:MAG: hypothetical protein ABIN97_13405 [Ginsengibacter sp.]
MNYKIKGNLCGFLCEDCTEPIFPAEVLLYLPSQKERVIAATVANTKETFRAVGNKERDSRKELLLTRTKTDAQGNFEFSVDEKYANTAFDIDFVCGNVPRIPPKGPRKEPVQFHLTTFYPQWRIENASENYYYNWKYCITSKWWCYIRGYYFDAWVICGHLRNCETGAPIANATVTAWDADFLTDDNLGSATTDAGGHFRIDYTSVQFKQTFLSPWINVETDPGTLTFNSGPDVYFKASIGGVTLIDETSANRRNNVGYCLCVDLCTKINVGDPGDTNFPSAWTGIGTAFNISTGIGPKDFDADGYAGSGKYGLSSVIRLTGQAAPKAASGNPIEYRFRISDVTTPNGGAAPALANFTKIVGVTPGLFVAGTVAKLMEKVFPFTVYDVISDQADFDAEGWFDVNSAIARTQIINGLGSLSNYWFIDEDTLVALNTSALTTAPDVAPGVANAGDVFPAGSKIPIEKVAIRFEIREVVNKPANIFNVIAGSGKTLNSGIINNNSSFLKFAVQELQTLGDCSPVSGTLHAKYTVHHPHLQSTSINVHNNSWTINKGLSDSFIPLSGNTNAAVNAGNNNSLQINASPNDLVRCTYAITLYVQRRLHNGDSQLSHEEQQILFFYDI